MAYYAYILRSQSSGQFYIGHTEDLRKRIVEHNNNRTRSTRPCYPELRQALHELCEGIREKLAQYPRLARCLAPHNSINTR
jgi:predicted GIY-YIG superfamily endonuclease